MAGKLKQLQPPLQARAPSATLSLWPYLLWPYLLWPYFLWPYLLWPYLLWPYLLWLSPAAAAAARPLLATALPTY